MPGKGKSKPKVSESWNPFAAISGRKKRAEEAKPKKKRGQPIDWEKRIREQEAAKKRAAAKKAATQAAKPKKGSAKPKTGSSPMVSGTGSRKKPAAAAKPQARYSKTKHGKKR